MLRLIYNETSKKWENEYVAKCRLIEGIVYADENYQEIGYFESTESYRISDIGTFKGMPILMRNCKIPLYFNRSTGYYSNKIPDNEIVFAHGEFPYSFNRYYSTRFLEETFQKKHNVKSEIDFKYINELPYTFGLEFETSAGYIPEDDLYRVGLIPLRDGSITGLEYSTIVLEGNQGLNSLVEQVLLLKEYTIFDKECSLHIHFGGFKLTPEVLLRLNNLFSTSNVIDYLVPYAFTTGKYKNTGKEYCKRNPYYNTFGEMYYTLVGRNFYGDLYQPHPSDTSGNQKWHINTRYQALNLINAICYNHGKTAEFRVLRPTYNFNKILVWIFIFGAYIKYAESLNLKAIRNISIDRIISTVYSTDLANLLLRALKLQKEVRQTQILVNDYIGLRVDIEDQILTYKNLSKNNTFFY